MADRCSRTRGMTGRHWHMPECHTDCSAMWTPRRAACRLRGTVRGRSHRPRPLPQPLLGALPPPVVCRGRILWWRRCRPGMERGARCRSGASGCDCALAPTDLCRLRRIGFFRIDRAQRGIGSLRLCRRRCGRRADDWLRLRRRRCEPMDLKQDGADRKPSKP